MTTGIVHSSRAGVHGNMQVTIKQRKNTANMDNIADSEHGHVEGVVVNAVMQAAICSSTVLKVSPYKLRSAHKPLEDLAE